MSISKDTTKKKSLLAMAKKEYGKRIHISPLKYDEDKYCVYGEDGRLLCETILTARQAIHTRHLFCIFRYLNDIDLSDAEVLGMVAESPFIKIEQFSAGTKTPIFVIIGEGLKTKIKITI